MNNPLLQAKNLLVNTENNLLRQKIPLIPPLLVDDRLVTAMKTKANIFNKIFAEQCTPLKNDSKLLIIKFSNTIAIEFLRPYWRQNSQNNQSPKHT